jgi:anti-sigma28 factor (negative regulator of flagellin synthesis)
MTVLAVRHETGLSRRFARRDESRMTQLRELIERDEYAVDPEKVAEAIVRRLMLEASPPRG